MTNNSLFEQLKHPNPNLRQRAMVQIAESRDETTIPRLMEVLSEEDVVYRRAAVKALGVIGEDAVAPLIESLLNSDNPIVCSSCTKALAQIAVNYPDLSFSTEALQGLKTTLNHANPVVYTTAVMALGEMGSQAFDILVEALNTTDNIALSVSIVNALGSLGEPRAAEVLTALANDKSADPYIQESAISAASRLEQVMNFQQKNAQ